MQQFQPDSYTISLPVCVCSLPAREGTLQLLAQLKAAPDCPSRAGIPQTLSFLTLFAHLCLPQLKPQRLNEPWAESLLQNSFEKQYFCGFFFPQLQGGSLQFYLLLISWLTESFSLTYQQPPATLEPFQDQLQKCQNQKSTANPRKKHLLNTNIQLSITKERENNWKK